MAVTAIVKPDGSLEAKKYDCTQAVKDYFDPIGIDKTGGFVTNVASHVITSLADELSDVSSAFGIAAGVSAFSSMLQASVDVGTALKSLFGENGFTLKNAEKLLKAVAKVCSKAAEFFLALLKSGMTFAGKMVTRIFKIIKESGAVIADLLDLKTVWSDLSNIDDNAKVRAASPANKEEVKGHVKLEAQARLAKTVALLVLHATNLGLAILAVALPIYGMWMIILSSIISVAVHHFIQIRTKRLANAILVNQHNAARQAEIQTYTHELEQLRLRQPGAQPSQAGGLSAGGSATGAGAGLVSGGGVTSPSQPPQQLLGAPVVVTKAA